MNSATCQSAGKDRNKLLFSPFAPYATMTKAKSKPGKKKCVQRDLLRNESEPVLIASDRTTKSSREKKDLLPSPFAQMTPRSLPISPSLNLQLGMNPPLSQSAARSLFQACEGGTRLTQVTAELQTYKQECKRLKDQLEQVLTRSSDSRIAQLEEQLQALRSENLDLKAALQRLTSQTALPSPRRSITTKKQKPPITLSTPKLKHKPVHISKISPKCPSLPQTGKSDAAVGSGERWTMEGLIGRVREEEVWPLLRHVAYRMQLEGWGKDKLAEVIGENTQRKELESVFEGPPISFSSLEASLLTRYLLQLAFDSHSLASKDIVRILGELLPNWLTFSPSSSLLLTQELHSSFRPHSQALLALCTAYDPATVGWISPDLFCAALERVGITLREEAIRYLEMLCYSENKELDQVPYKELLLDYENTETAAVSMLSTILSDLADYLKTSGLRPKDLFACEFGYIYPEGLVQGLQQVPGLIIGETEVMTLLEALQDPKMEEICIEMKHLEQVMKALGVEVSKAQRFHAAQLLLHQSQASLPYIKQVSFLQEEEK